jgi:hypothetical protein
MNDALIPPGAVATTEQEHAQWAYTWCEHTNGLKLPYIFGGGHGILAEHPWGIPPTQGQDPEDRIGYDCSSTVSGALWYAGVLDGQVALDTEELEDWGEPGRGQYLTVWVIDELSPSGLHHCGLELTLPAPRTHRFFVARHTGTVVGWFPDEAFFTEGYNARRMKL